VNKLYNAFYENCFFNVENIIILIATELQ